MAQNLPTAPSSGYDTSGRYPAGAINTISYYSSVAGRNVDMMVYTPPGYNTSQKYGVVYCYQGISTGINTIFADWCVGAGIVCDNLIGEGKISKGVIIVAVDDQYNGTYGSDVQGMTLRDVIPYIDSHYSTYADAQHRGVYGFSWGGGYAFNIGCQNLDYFHHIGPTAAAPSKAGDDQLFPNGGAAFKALQNKTLFFSWGEGDYDSIKSANWNCHYYCDANGIPHSYWEVPGQGHTSGVWRPAMWNFLQLADRNGISKGDNTGTGVTFYQDYNYGGSASQALGVGSYTTSQLAAKGVVNDWASSVKVPSGYTVKMYADDNFSGTSWTLTADQSEFGSIGANDKVSSVVVGLSVTGTKKIIARHSGKAMDAYKQQTGNGTQIQQWTYWGGSNQKWTVSDTGSGYYKIMGVQSGKSLDIDYSSGGTANGTKVQLWDYWNGPSQQFKFAATDSGYFRITPNCATGSCLDVSGISTADGAVVHLWQWLGGNNQQWSFQAP
jgi:enterochelin esterase family protein